jgi:hypothetical protein
MTDIQKNNILFNCNTISIINILKIIEEGEITLDEFITAGLDASKIEEIEKERRKAINIEKEESEKEEIKSQKTVHLDKILKGRIFAEEIKGLINKRAITFDDILDAGVSSKTVNALKNYCSTERISKITKIDDLPPMEEGRTDVYFVGLPRAGKSTMIAGLLNVAHRTGILLPDPYNIEGLNFKDELIQNLDRGVIPLPTPEESYNYIAASLNDANKKRHPLNIVDVPGELYNKIQGNPEVDKFLKYINNKNKKILIFVIDPLENPNNKFLQNTVFPNIVQMFKDNGVLEQTDAIYLVVNKFDAIKDTKHSYDGKCNGDIALDYITDDEFRLLGLKNNCIAARADTRNSIKIKVMPFSIGSLSYGSILNTLDKSFAQTLLNQIMKDSFIVSGGVNKIFK